jgi:hypothetical protein
MTSVGFRDTPKTRHGYRAHSLYRLLPPCGFPL